ncbi:nucleocapsid [Spilikins virus]|uniref:Nucleocapsid n=1 Tax=Spilikins virus TaxID=2895617 RepID=A0AAE8ZKY9_9VIRU|nr:nucleocapsid [Spilikins virus]
MSKTIELSGITVVDIPLTLDFPNALSRQDIGKAKDLETCLKQFRGKLPALDEMGKSIATIDMSIKPDLKTFIDEPGFGYKLIFNINSKTTVGKIKDTQSTSMLRFVDNDSDIKILMIKGETKLTQTQLSENLSMGDMQKISAIYTNSIVDVFYKEKGVLAMLPQARSRYSDQCVETLAGYVYRDNAKMEKQEKVTSIVKCMNFGCLRKPHQCSSSVFYDANMSMAMGLYGLLSTSKPSSETMRIGRDNLKKIAGQSVISKPTVQALLGIMIETSGEGSATVDQLIEDSQQMIARMSVPKEIGIRTAPTTLMTVGAAPANDEELKKTKAEMNRIQIELARALALLEAMKKKPGDDQQPSGSGQAGGTANPDLL